MLTKIKNFINSFTESRECVVYDDSEMLAIMASSQKKFDDSMYELELLREQAAGRIYDV